ncbi:hypothetical protein [Xenorhabdus miraniensis]|uniref:hypothetical protein n=1 Tax=Xenorhabdus miraniensis TaxID=351674 RepID=UPI00142E8ED7|nr:hypothetical protein [Xenorhabdus miraniensis]
MFFPCFLLTISLKTYHSLSTLPYGTPTKTITLLDKKIRAVLISSAIRLRNRLAFKAKK